MSRDDKKQEVYLGDSGNGNELVEYEKVLSRDVEHKLPSFLKENK